MAAVASKGAGGTVLVTGGAGYIGTHTLCELLSSGYKAVVLDNLDNSSPEALARVREISGCGPDDLVHADCDLVDLDATDAVFQRHGPFAACVHFAGLKAVGESCSMPLMYYANNLTGTINLLMLLQKYSCRNLVFSSSATVYGDPECVPITEAHPLRSTNPYGRTKLFIEDIIRDTCASEQGLWNVALLRYFNPIGAHPSGRIGEDPKGIPNNLLPYVTQVAVGRRKELSVFGGDYDTPDGTGVRDYIHVVDLAKGHVAALGKLQASSLNGEAMGAVPYNLGTGRGSSVLEVVAALEKAAGRKVPYKIAPRRPGDVASCFADVSKAQEELSWSASLSLEEGCRDSWRWQEANPNGFSSGSSGEDGASKRKCIVFHQV